MLILFIILFLGLSLCLAGYYSGKRDHKDMLIKNKNPYQDETIMRQWQFIMDLENNKNLRDINEKHTNRF